VVVRHPIDEDQPVDPQQGRTDRSVEQLGVAWAGNLGG